MVNMSSVVYTNSNSKNGTASMQYYNKISDTSSSLSKHQISAAVKMFKYQNIAPAPTNHTSSAAMGAEIKTRKYTPRAPSAGGGPYSVDQTQSVQRRNARERNRVKQVNNSFARLRQHIPQTIITDLLKGGGRGPHKKISKVDTLRIAVEYIRRLQDLVDDLNVSGSSTGSNSSVPQKCFSARVQSGNNALLMDATDNNTTSSNSSYSSTSSRSSSSSTNSDSGNNVNLRADEAPTRSERTSASALAAAEQLYFASAANGDLQANVYLQHHEQHQQQQQQQQQRQQQQQQQQFTSALLTAEALQTFSPQTTQAQTHTQLEVGCPSPTSSFNSSMSFDSGTFVHSPAPQQQLSPLPHAASDAQHINSGSSGNNNAHAQIDANLQLKFEPYDSFNLHEEDCTPDDEEILDYISLWQEQ